MAEIASGGDSKILLEVDRTYMGLRSSMRPLEFNTKEVKGGHFRAVLSTGLVTGVAAGGALASFRWTDVARKALVKRVQAHACLTTAFTTAQENSVDLVKVGSFSASDTGGTAIAMNGTGRASSEMAVSQVADLRVATTAALGAGAGAVEEANAYGIHVFNLGNALANAAQGLVYEHDPGSDHPLELNPQDGFRVRNVVAQGAVGVVRFRFVIDWLEAPISLWF